MNRSADTVDDAPTLAALWQSVAALPECRTRRGVLADYLDECGMGEEAEAVRETADRKPDKLHHHDVWYWKRARWCFYSYSIISDVFDRMVDGDGVLQPDGSAYRDYPTCLDALRDLVRATVAVNRKAVTA
jgi:uncharacterized protein (TIGR02996 family)